MTLTEPVITEKISLKLSGMVYYGNPVHTSDGWNVGNEIGKLWNRFIKVNQDNQETIQKQTVEPGIAYEAHIAYAGEKNQEYHIFVGIETTKPIQEPIEFFYKELPPTRYAIFTAKGLDMADQMEEVYTEWLPNSQYIESYPMMIQRYDQKKYKGLDNPSSEIEFMIPIKEREDEG